MSILNLIAASIVAILAMGAPDLSARSSSGISIEVISASHEIHYPDEVLFELEAESGSTITEVVLFYRLGHRDISVYAYPEFTPAERISADFSLKTSGGNYIPAGVDIEYFYLISDEAGSSIKTQAYSLEYLDSRYQWQRLRQRELTFLWHDIPSDRVHELAESVDHRLQIVKQLLGLDETPRMKAVLFVKHREAELGFPVISEAASAGHLFGGFAFPEYGLFVLAGLSEDGMVHEATHLLIEEAAGSPLARVPAWLNEGLAMYSERSPHGRQAIVEKAVLSDSLLTISAMAVVPGKPPDVRLFYDQAWSMVKHMVDIYGAERMASLLRAMNSGVRIDAAFADVYGMPLEEFERRWRTSMLDQTSLVPRPGPGPIAISSITTGVVIITILTSIYLWNTRRNGHQSPVR